MDRDDLILFSESNSRFLIEVAPDDREQFERILGKTCFAHIGQVSLSKMLEIDGIGGKKVVSISIGELKEAWQKPLSW